MNVGGPRRSGFLVLLCLAALGSGRFGAALAADPPVRILDDYLKQFGYGIPFKFNESDEPIIQGELNGKKLNFGVDSGCDFTRLDKSIAGAFKTPAQMGVTLEDTLLGTITNSSVVIMEKLVLGRAQFLNQPAAVTELQMDFISAGFDGLLGCDFFVRNFCMIDCGGRRLYVRSARPSEEQSNALAQTLRQSGFGEVKLLLHGMPTLEALINEQPVLLGVDTGSFTSMLDESLVRPLGLSMIEQRATGTLMEKNDLSTKVVGLGKIGAHNLRMTKLKHLQIGPRSWQDVPFGVTNLKAWGIGEGENAASDPQGVLGAEMLSGHGALIDFASGTLWFRPKKKNS